MFGLLCAAVATSPHAWDGMHELHPNIHGVKMRSFSASAFDGVECNDAELRCLVVVDEKILLVLIPEGIKREVGSPLLIAWDYMKLIPPSWYSIVVEIPGSSLVTPSRPTRYMAVPEDRL